MIVADQIVDSSITNYNSDNEEVDDDFKRVNEVLESLKACVFSNPTFFLDKKLSRSPKRAPK